MDNILCNKMLPNPMSKSCYDIFCGLPFLTPCSLLLWLSSCRCQMHSSLVRTCSMTFTDQVCMFITALFLLPKREAEEKKPRNPSVI